MFNNELKYNDGDLAMEGYVKMTQTVITNTDRAWVRRWVRETMTKLGYPELGDKVKIIFRPMIRKTGVSEWQVHRKVATGHRVDVDGFTIIFSESLWPHMGREERYETVVHECCHIVDALERDIIGDPHGDTWQKLMQRLGRAGEPTVSLEQLEISENIVYGLIQKCSLCETVGHNARTCKYRKTKEGEKLNEIFKKNKKS